MKRFFALALAGLLLLACTGCGGNDNPTTQQDTTPIQTTTETAAPQPQGETKRFQRKNLILEVTNVAHEETKTGLDHDTDPYDYTVYTIYPGAQITVINADMYDGVDFEDGLPHGKYYVYDSSKGLSEEIDEYIWITDDMPPLTLTPDMTHVGVEMIGILRFEMADAALAQES